MSIKFKQKDVIIGSIAGLSLLFHLFSAGNFIPASEMWFFGSILSYFHSGLNLIVRLSLLSILAMIGSEYAKPGTLPRLIGINRSIFPEVMFKLMAAAFAVSLVRMILPGPVTHYSRFYKLSVFLNLVGSIGLVLSTGATISLRTKPAFRRRSPTSPPPPPPKKPKDDEDFTPEDDDSRSRR